MEQNISTYCMNNSILARLSKSQLLTLLVQALQQNAKLQQQPQTPITTTRKRTPIPTPRKSVKQMVQNYENNIILPPLEFRDDYKPVPLPRTRPVPVPVPRTRPVPRTDQCHYQGLKNQSHYQGLR